VRQMVDGDDRNDLAGQRATSNDQCPLQR
jgi:hypothetical protein